ncbi:MAG: lipid-A-disaccharide synthase [Desulfotalea sp.]
MTKKNKEIMIVTGEASGDLHGANLVRAMRAIDDTVEFRGMGGPELTSLGIDILCDSQEVAVVGLTEVISHLPAIFKSKSLLAKSLKLNPPDLLIIIDLPDFNLMLAKVAKKLGVKVFYYITPQVWAWRTGRVKTIAERVDQLGVILPFEQEFFRKNGLEANYVGHPLLDQVECKLSKDDFLKKYNIKNHKCIGLIPGSRSKEVSSLLPDMLSAAKLIQQESKDQISFLIPKAASISMKEIQACGLEEFNNILDIHIIPEDRYELMASCDAVMAASGTVTLELAILKVPMLVVYRASKISYWIGIRVIQVDFFSLVNLIGEGEIVKELLQDAVTPKNMADEIISILYGKRGPEIKEGLDLVSSRLGNKGASEKAAKLAFSLLG